MAEGSLILVERIEKTILYMRGEKVILDRDLAKLYGVSTKTLNQAVKRNLDRFPEDFMFHLSREEAEIVSRSQTVTLKRGANIKYLPYAFTEQGVAMLSSVLRASGPLKSTSRSCALSCGCGKSWPRTRILHESWRNWRRSTTPIFRPSSRPFAS